MFGRLTAINATRPSGLQTLKERIVLNVTPLQFKCKYEDGMSY